MSDKVKNQKVGFLMTRLKYISDIPEEVNPTDTSAETTGCKRWIELLCAIRSTNEGRTEEKDHIQDIKSFLGQGKTMATVLNFAAVLLIIIVVFITAFYH